MYNALIFVFTAVCAITGIITSIPVISQWMRRDTGTIVSGTVASLRPWRWWATAIVSVAALALSIVGIYRISINRELVEVYAPFKFAHDAHLTELGDPVAGETRLSQTWELKYKNAWVFWTENNNAFYRFPISGGTWSEVHHPAPPDNTWDNGVEFAKSDDPLEWLWIGNEEWPSNTRKGCSITTHPTYIQEFQKGKLLGVVPLENGNPQVIVFLNDGRVRFANTSESATGCD